MKKSKKASHKVFEDARKAVDDTEQEYTGVAKAVEQTEAIGPSGTFEDLQTTEDPTAFLKALQAKTKTPAPMPQFQQQKMMKSVTKSVSKVAAPKFLSEPLPNKRIGRNSLFSNDADEVEAQKAPPSPPPLPPPSKPAAKLRKYPQENDEHQPDNDAQLLGNNEYDQTALETKRLITSADLTTAKGRLKAHGLRDPGLVAMDRARLFDQFRNVDYYPLEQLTGLFPAKASPYVTSIDLTGVEQLTDMFFVTIRQNHADSSYFRFLTDIILNGCYHLTDLTVNIMSDVFRNIQSVSVAGCRKITERSITKLLSTNPQMESMNLTATNVGTVFVTQAAATVCQINLHGCPVVLPPYAMHERHIHAVSKDYLSDIKNEPEWQSHKVVILRCSNNRTNILQSLTSGKLNKNVQQHVPLSVQMNWSFGDGSSANLFECAEEMFGMLMSVRTVYVISYNASETVEHSVLNITGQLIPLISKIEHAVIILVGEVQDKNVTSSDDVLNAVKTRLDTLKESVRAKAKEWISNDRSPNFVEQMRLARAFRLHQCPVELAGAVVLKDDQGVAKLKSMIHKATESVNRLLPVYSRIPSHLSKLISAISAKPGLHSEIEVVDDLKKKNRSVFGDCNTTYKKILELLHMVGAVICLEATAGYRLVVTDVSWFAGELNSMTSSSGGDHLTTMSREMMDVLVSYGVLCRLCDETTLDPKPALTSSLPLEPLHPWYHFMKNSGSSDVHTLQYRYNFMHSMSASVVTQLISSLMEWDFEAGCRSNPIVAWQSGVVWINAPITIGLQALKALNTPHWQTWLAGDDLQLILQAQVVKSTHADIDMKMIKCLWNALEVYRFPLEHAIHRRGLSCKFEVSFDGGLDTTGKAVQPDKDVGVVGIASQHSIGEVRLKSSRIPAVSVCEHCNVAADSLAKLWRMRCETTPTFLTEKFSTEAGIRVHHGNYIETSAMGDCQFRLQEMNCHDFCELRLTVLEGKGAIDIELRPVRKSTDSADFNEEKIEFELSKTEEIKSSVPSKKKAATPTVDTIWPKSGDTVNLRLTRKLDSNNKPYQEVSVLWNDEHFSSKTAQCERAYVPVLFMAASMAVVVDATLMPKRAYSMFKWQRGMRLEALDLKTPHLICCACVEDVNESKNEILVHFDGWSERYDYWCSLSATHIHPIGWFEQRHGNHPEYSETLQPPNGYGKPFDWDEYLMHVNDIPAPYELFTLAQTELCSPYKLKAETIAYLNAKGKSASVGAQCYAVGHRPQALMKKEVVPWMMKGHIRNIPLSPLAVFLPRDLTLQQLMYPNTSIVQAADKQSWHVICTGRGDSLHFEDTEGVPVPPGTDLSQYYQMACTVMGNLSASEAILPDNVKTFVKGAENVDRTALEEKLQQLFRLYVFVMYLLRPVEQPEDVSDGETKVLQQCTELWDKLCETEPIKSTFLTTYAGHATECLSHHYVQNHGSSTLPADAEGDVIKLSRFDNHTHLIHDISYSHTDIESVPDEMFTTLTALTTVRFISNRIQSIPRGIGNCKNLTFLDLSENNISSLPDDFGDAMNTVKCLKISNNPLLALPASIAASTVLVELHANAIGVEELPDTFAADSNLSVLKLGENNLRRLPPSFANLKRLEILELAGVKGIENWMMVSRSQFDHYMERNPLLKRWDKKDQDALFASCDERNSGMLDKNGTQKLAAQIYKMFNRFGQQQTDASEQQDEYCGCPPEIFSLTSLRRLDLSYHAFVTLTPHFEKLTSLEELVLSNNLLLESLPGKLSKLQNLKELSLRGCNSIKTPPKEIIHRGFVAIMGFLRRLEMGSVECKRTKLMFVGLGGAGKTSLVNSLTKGDYVSSGSYGERITDGIDITTWIASNQAGTEQITFSVWDFAGQTVYYNTHQFFLSNRAVYLLLWNIRLGYEHAGLDFWLSSIACHAPKAPVLIIGSHRDQVQKFWFPEEEIRKRYPQVRGCYAVSSYSGEGINALRYDLADIALKEKYMGERIPEVWLNFETAMMKYRDEESVLTWEKVEECAIDTGIIDKVEVTQAIQFLHDLGSVQHFQNDFLKSRVVINPQWIVDAMSCIVSVHNTPIKEGKLYHTDIGLVWEKYPEELRPWLLRLTEEFDLTFPSKDEPANIVPCLLPANEPEINWPESGSKEMKMVYRFEYLPAGLFNRVQVRLYQFSDSSAIWKNGSFLRKNGHVALLTTEEQSNVLVKVNGPRPENILFMVHEVFETLILQSFHGVSYDLFIPCIDCIKAGSYDPSMFASSKIRRASQLKVPFLQCDSFFHTISLAELQTMMPPDSDVDFDMHLERSLQDLNNLRSDMTYDVFMVYCAENIPRIGEDDTKVAPRMIYNDLTKAGLKVWFSSDPANIDIAKVMVTLREAKVILFCISNEFILDEVCTKLFYVAKSKTPQIVLLGANKDWSNNSDIGMQLAAEVFVNMMDSARNRYPDKLTELIGAIKSKIAAAYPQPVAVFPKIFISYCWLNSIDAVKKGTKELKGALGVYDPRTLKSTLESKGLSAWMDIDKVAQGTLFEEIADGLKHAKVVIVCVSDEYVKSKNCMMEFRFAAVQLNVPIILAVVGTGYEWEKSEISMVCLGSPKINFQLENPTAFDQLLTEIGKYVTEEDVEEERNATMASPGALVDNQYLAFQELIELAERKFLREVMLYADSMETSPFPRLFVLDFLNEAEKQLLNPAPAAEDKSSGDEHQCPKQTGKEENNPNTTANKTDKVSEEPHSRTASRQSLRPASASKLHRPTLERRETKPLPVFAEDAFVETNKQFEYCIRMLCENEEGWHVTSQYVPLTPFSSNAEWEAFLVDIAAYMSRLLAVLRHTSLDLSILTTERGNALRKTLEEKCGTGHEFKTEYIFMRKLVMSANEGKEVTELARCHLASGKILWLCDEHQKLERASVVSDDVADVVPTRNRSAGNVVDVKEQLSKSDAVVAGKAATVATTEPKSARDQTRSSTPAGQTSSRQSANGRVGSGRVERPASSSTTTAAAGSSSRVNSSRPVVSSKSGLDDGAPKSSARARQKMAGAELAVLIATGQSTATGSKACVVM